MECSICFENIYNDNMVTKCKHKFHYECFMKNESNYCPICSEICHLPINLIYKNNNLESNKIELSSKFFKYYVYNDSDNVTFYDGFDNILKMDRKLNDINYIIINTDYTERLIHNIEVNKDEFEIIYNGYFNLNDSYIQNKELDIILRKELKDEIDGSCVFTETKSSNLYEYVNKLTDLEYCGCCNHYHICEIKWYTLKNGMKILYCSIDTESG